MLVIFKNKRKKVITSIKTRSMLITINNKVVTNHYNNNDTRNNAMNNFITSNYDKE